MKQNYRNWAAAAAVSISCALPASATEITYKLNRPVSYSTDTIDKFNRVRNGTTFEEVKPFAEELIKNPNQYPPKTLKQFREEGRNNGIVRLLYDLDKNGRPELEIVAQASTMYFGFIAIDNNGKRVLDNKSEFSAEENGFIFGTTILQDLWPLGISFDTNGDGCRDNRHKYIKFDWENPTIKEKKHSEKITFCQN